MILAYSHVKVWPGWKMAFVDMCRLLAPFSFPFFTGCLPHIAGWQLHVVKVKGFKEEKEGVHARFRRHKMVFVSFLYLGLL